MSDISSGLKVVASALNKTHKFNIALSGDCEVRSDVTKWVPTKSVLLNLLMGHDNYGIAAGRVYELFGDFSDGKSTIAQLMMNAFQEAGGVSVLLDTESAWNRSRAIDMGHNPERHMTLEADTCELGFAVIHETVSLFKSTFSGEVPILFVWDTLAASPTEDERNGDQYASGMTYKPRLIRSELRKLAPELKGIQASVVFVNQTIESMKPTRSGVKTTPGGGGVKFWASQRLQVSRVGTVRPYSNKKGTSGIISSIKLVKNKLHPPFRSADIPLDFISGLDVYQEVCNYLLDNTSVLNTAGAYRRIVGFKDSDISFYEKDTPKVFEDNPGLYAWMVDQVKSHWLTGDTF